MQTYCYVNKTKRQVSLQLPFPLPHQETDCQCHPECVDKWNKQQHHSTFKLGIEVKAVFTKNNPSIQNPEADPLIEHRIMTTPLASTWVQHATQAISSIKIVTSSSLCCFTTQEAMICILSSKKVTKMKYGCEFEGIPNS